MPKKQRYSLADMPEKVIMLILENSDFRSILTASEIPEEFKKVLKANPLKTECFAITTSGPNEILDVISSIDSGNLKEICFYNIDELPEEVWDFEEIVKLEQWKNSAILEMVQFYVHLEIWNFLHFSQAHFRILEITVDDIFELKKNYLLMPSFKFVHVEYKNLIGEIYEMGATELGNHQKWLFKFPENSEFVLEVSLSPKNLYFRKIPVSHVPDSALI
ncbi:Protein CBG04869 [Caenorhabditis briggsae]|uniref:Protein CBG04869 n=1 Tax=Caenorhabditis briggsae TaxID=6238 RepID=A8WYN9_CAEBR|nr:Protein CBG04869 [Caenorhabditis briggsae]CAP25497.2 Protein CBG04869 [Caenorhabditis briggsae]